MEDKDLQNMLNVLPQKKLRQTRRREIWTVIEHELNNLQGQPSSTDLNDPKDDTACPRQPHSRGTLHGLRKSQRSTVMKSLLTAAVGLVAAVVVVVGVTDKSHMSIQRFDTPGNSQSTTNVYSRETLTKKLGVSKLNYYEAFTADKTRFYVVDYSLPMKHTTFGRVHVVGLVDSQGKITWKSIQSTTSLTGPDVLMGLKVFRLPDERYLVYAEYASGGDGTERRTVCAVYDGTVVKEFQHIGYRTSICIAPNGNLVFADMVPQNTVPFSSDKQVWREATFVLRDGHYIQGNTTTLAGLRTQPFKNVPFTFIPPQP